MPSNLNQRFQTLQYEYAGDLTVQRWYPFQSPEFLHMIMGKKNKRVTLESEVFGLSMDEAIRSVEKCQKTADTISQMD